MFFRAPLAALAAASLFACMPGAVETGAVSGQGCRASPDCPQGFFCVEGACQTQAGACKSQSDCNLPDVCTSGHCLPGCTVTGCDTGQACDKSTGRCAADNSGDAGVGDATDAGGGGTPDAGGGGTPDAGGGGIPDAGIATSVTNGNFETGTLAGWITSGQTSISTDAHSGSSSAMVGSASASSDSAIEQDLMLPAGAQLSFWYKSVCLDTVTYDWGTVTAKSPAGAVLATALPHTCTRTGSWVQQTADLSSLAGQTVVLSFENHDDGSASDPTYTLYDDIQVGSGSGGPAPDFLLSASPGSLSGAGNATVGSAGLNGFAGSIVLSVSGAPAGATASLSATSISAGGSATLALAPGSAAAGTYAIAVTGTSGSLTHVASISWTIAGAVPPDFSLSASPGSVSGSGSATISVNPSGGFSGAVSLAASGAPSGATASLSSSSVSASGSATLTLSPGSGAAGTYTVTVTGSSGSLSHAASVSWTIAAAVCTPDTWSNYAHSFMTANCTYCHGQFNTYSNVQSDQSSIQSRISSGNMPQDHSLSSSDKQRILTWLSCGLPQ